MYTPSREDFAALAARGNLVPVYRELLADDDTPVSAYAAVGDAPYSFLLESVVGGATWAAYSFVGVAPRAIVRWQAGEATVTWLDVEGDATAAQRTDAYATTDPLEALELALAQLRPVDVPGLPRFWGGAVGWIAYDCVNAFDRISALPGGSAARPGEAGAFDHVSALPGGSAARPGEAGAFDHVSALPGGSAARPGEAGAFDHVSALPGGSAARPGEAGAFDYVSALPGGSAARPGEAGAFDYVSALPGGSAARPGEAGAFDRTSALPGGSAARPGEAGAFDRVSALPGGSAARPGEAGAFDRVSALPGGSAARPGEAGAFDHVGKPPAPDLPPLCMALTDTLVIFDNLRQTLKVVATARVDDATFADRSYDRACARIDAVVARLRAPRRPLPSLEPPRADDPAPAIPASSFGEAGYVAAVARIKDYILAGDAFQVVLSQRFALPRAGARPLDVYRALRVINPSPYMFHLEFPDARVTGASPETLVRASDGRVEVRPIAGTRPRGKTAADDDRLAAELLGDAKERAEHLMLVDLGRNDVGRVAATGSVRVAEHMVVEKYSHVMHMTSHVVGELAAGRTWRDALRAAFPAGTLSGAPKIRAMQIIDELEPHPRGIYGGAVGYVSYTGNLDLAIAIRTLVSRGDDVFVQAGAGIVADSVPELEHAECVNKARAVLRAVAMARTAEVAHD